MHVDLDAFEDIVGAMPTSSHMLQHRVSWCTNVISCIEMNSVLNTRSAKFLSLRILCVYGFLSKNFALVIDHMAQQCVAGLIIRRGLLPYCAIATFQWFYCS